MPRTMIESVRRSSRLSLGLHLVPVLAEVLARRRDRQILSRLDAHLLRDIGLSPDEARTEAAKPFWKA
jgi:uncharacterized protein YjiS (DUF1127 family)